MQTDLIFNLFIDFFSKRGHKSLASAPLVPLDDKSLLWINSGIAALKRYFDGREVPPCKRLVGVQKSLRTNDIEHVGFTERHHTFFEMLGNFSIGDYFKEDAINFAFELLTSSEGFSLPVERLYITAHPEDDETCDLWYKLGIPRQRIVQLKDNFWDLGVGPSGPNTEIFYDRGEVFGSSKAPGGDDGRFLEIWNLVFSQYNHMPDGSYAPLPSKNIDTGMGLERMALVLQDAETTYETDRFTPIIDFLADISKTNYGMSTKNDRSMRVIADHIRALVVTIAEGVNPSADGRGYVLRRLLRRAMRFGHVIGLKDLFLHRLVPVVISTLKTPYPELVLKEAQIEAVITGEEKRFNRTLGDGLTRLQHIVDNLGSQKVLDGKEAFRLYDTYGLPLDVTADVLQEQGLGVDKDGFVHEMEEQRIRARSAQVKTSGMNIQSSLANTKLPESRFVGYGVNLNHTVRITSLAKEDKLCSRLSEGEEGIIWLEATPFYAESGGQLADHGMIVGDKGKAEVSNVQHTKDLGYHHYVKITQGYLSKEDIVQSIVDMSRRRDIARNHTAIHLLHYAVRKLLGSHAVQAGSLVTPTKLRLDISHHKALTEEELLQIEVDVNQKIDADIPVQIFSTSLAEAKRSGAMALFSENYGEKVRVVQIGRDNLELCGGTHVERTSALRSFVLLSEGSIGSGMRRFEALTGRCAHDYLDNSRRMVLSLAKTMKVKSEEVLVHIDDLKNRSALLEQENNDLKIRSLKQELVPSILKQVQQAGSLSFVVSKLENISPKQLLVILDQLRTQIDGVIVLGSSFEDRAHFIVHVAKKWIENGLHANQIVSIMAEYCGGTGGGQSHLARAGGKDVANLKNALGYAKNWLKKHMEDNVDDKTIWFRAKIEEDVSPREVLQRVYKALEEDKCYNRVYQIVGYLLTGEPAYIPRRNKARFWISKVDRDKLLEELLRSYPGLFDYQGDVTND